MNSDQFYRSRQQDWKALESLLGLCQDGTVRLNPAQVEKLGMLYRAVTADLAVAQRDFPEQKVSIFLNQLVARAHAVVYRGQPLAWRRLWRFATHGFPRVYRETARFILGAALLFILPAIISGVLVNRNPAAARWLLPPQAAQLEPLIESGHLWTDIPVNERPYASSFIMTNNIQVVFLAFGTGVLVGIFTLWVMVFNGLMLGGITGLTAYHDLGFDLWTFVIGHGVLELSVIFLAGGAGLSLGWAILQPGLLRRRDALSIAARRSVRLIIGAVPLLVLAGLIEGFISPAEYIPWPVKWGIGIFTGVLFYAYVGLAGRAKRA